MKKLKAHLIKHPILAVIYVLMLALLFRILDIYVLSMDERIGEIILSKTAGLILILLFLFYIGKSPKDISLHNNNIKISIKLALIQVILALSVIFGIRYLFIRAKDGEPYFTISDEYTILTAIMFVFIGNIINSLMEEGLFRGIMITTFIKKFSFWKVNTIQATLFGLWHITWPIKQYTLGEFNFQTMIINCIIYALIAVIMGFIMGYMYYKTNNLWTSIIWHTIWNSTMNLLVIKSAIYSDNSIVMNSSFMIFWIIFLIYSIFSLFITKIFINKKHAQTIQM